MLKAEQTAWLADHGVVPTNDAAKYDWDRETSGSVRAIYTSSGFVDSAKEGDVVGIVLDATSFYAEAGGQVADSGTITVKGADGSEATVQVKDVQSYAGFVLHLGTIVTGQVETGAAATAQVDFERRRKTAPNHTMTHVLNHALRAVLGGDVTQKVPESDTPSLVVCLCHQNPHAAKIIVVCFESAFHGLPLFLQGSLVNDEKLRFDFSHGAALTAEQITRVEALVQGVVASALPVYSTTLPLAEAREISGLRAVFGETYPDPVRVVAVEVRLHL